MNILIISPEKFQKFHTSKIHIANYLQKKHNVFFLNPYSSIKELFCFHEKISKIKILNFFSINFLKFFVSHEFIERYYFKKIKKVIQNIDIVWGFDHDRDYLIKYLNANLKIFHITDEFKNKRSIQLINQYSNYIFSVSKNLAKGFKKKNTFIVGHFISEKFLKVKYLFKSNKKNIALTGNFFNQDLDIKSLEILIRNNPNLNFHLIGPISKNDFKYKLKLKKSRSLELINIKSYKNVITYGSVPPEKLILIYKSMDAFLILYKKKLYDNSHKILEYFSTGLPVFSSSRFLSIDSKYLIILKKNFFKKQILTNLLKRKKKYINILRFKKKKLTNKRTYGFLVNNVLKCFKNNNYKSLHELHLGRNGY